LLTQKLADYLLFKQAFDLIKSKEHLEIEGLNKIVNIKAIINKGLSDYLKAAFPNTIPVQRLQISNKKISDPYWLAGFTSGEGCFYVKIKKSSSHRIGFQVELVFHLTQHFRDEQLMKSIISYFKVGKCYYRNEAIDFKVTKIEDLTKIIIPFFDKYPIVGIKSQDYEDFKRVVELMNNGAHLTYEGLEKIRLIKSGMNKGRK